MPPRFTKLVESLPATVPFVGPETLERDRGAPFAARLGANESVFGPSPRVLKAMEEADLEIWKYGDSISHDLRQALAAHHGITPGNIVVGEGIDGLLGYLVRLVVEPGDGVVTSSGAYPTFNYHVNGFGGVLKMVPYRDDAEDLPALIARANDTGAKLVYLANPDNPMGSHWRGEEIATALEDLNPDTLFVLDEAYAEFAPTEAAVDLDVEDPRLIRMRTFSKAYGLAGARIGYAIGATPLIRAFEKIRNHFGMNRTAQVAALAALEDQQYLAQVVDQVRASRAAIVGIAKDHGLSALPSATNFVTVDMGGTGDLARAMVAALARRGVFVRMPFVAPQDRCIRVSCGTDADMAVLAEHFGPALEDAREAAQG
ncbi:pyridoxal phosphate-dependent aminotransferase [Pseudooceanicola nitratireducens]|uniref:pyridoxal phosphate-dependent aminotransferase n=1 Tax=Pseudooceanicola nitratireducens TaxID=517719 RepID=UPI0031099531